MCARVCVCVSDTQVVSHILWLASFDRVPSNASHPAAATSSPHSPCGATRHVLLHHDRLAQLPVWTDGILATPRDRCHRTHGGHTAVRWHGLGAEVRLAMDLIHTSRPLAAFYTIHRLLCYVLLVQFWVNELNVLLSYVHHATSSDCHCNRCRATDLFSTDSTQQLICT